MRARIRTRVGASIGTRVGNCMVGVEASLWTRMGTRARTRAGARVEDHVGTCMRDRVGNHAWVRLWTSVWDLVGTNRVRRS